MEGRVDTGGMTKMKDISLKGLKNVSGELIVNKLQDFVWDEVLSEHCMLPQVWGICLGIWICIMLDMREIEKGRMIYKDEGKIYIYEYKMRLYNMMLKEKYCCEIGTIE